MFINDSKYHKVWKVEEKNGIKKINLGDSKKNKDGTYTNWTWFGCACFGKAKDVDVQEGDTVTVISGQISQDKVGDKWFTNFVIFDMEVTKGSEKQSEGYSSEFEQLDDDSEIPF